MFNGASANGLPLRRMLTTLQSPTEALTLDLLVRPCADRGHGASACHIYSAGSGVVHWMGGDGAIATFLKGTLLRL